jgi:hypothetical protein
MGKLYFFIALIVMSNSLSAAPRKESSKEGGSVSTLNGFKENDIEVNESIALYANDCLKSLSSSVAVAAKDATFVKTASDEILKKILDKKQGRNIASIDSIQYPECYAFAKEINNTEIINLLGRKKVPVLSSPEVEPNATTGSTPK